MSIIRSARWNDWPLGAYSKTSRPGRSTSWWSTKSTDSSAASQTFPSSFDCNGVSFVLINYGTLTIGHTVAEAYMLMHLLRRLDRLSPGYRD